jgi:replicative DNA helicase
MALGAAMLDVRAFLGATIEFGVDSDWFKYPKHRLIWEAIERAHTQTQYTDVVTVSEILQKKNQLQIVGGLAYLAILVDLAQPITEEETNG